MTCGVMAQRLETEQGLTNFSRKEAAVNHSPIACGDARRKARCLGYATFLIEDATYVDPMMDAWGQDMAALLIDGLGAILHGLWAAIAKLIGWTGRSMPPPAPMRSFGERLKTPSASSRSPA
jgi:hypothetical protein